MLGLRAVGVLVISGTSQHQYRFVDEIITGKSLASLARTVYLTVKFCRPTPTRPRYPAVAINIDLIRKCRGELHANQDLVRLNVPIFIVVGLEDPHTDKHLRLSRQTFPCIFFLGDSPQEVAQVAGSRDPISGVGIGNMLVPFLDAMVVARP